MDLTSSDYKKIVKFYQVPKTNRQTYKQLAEKTLASKLCKCIKSVTNPNNNEDSAIAICRKNIFTNRNIDFGKFKCKNGARFLKKRGATHRLKKTNKRITFNKTKRRVK